MVLLRKTLEERFWEKVGLPDENGCMDWHGARQSRGYGRFFTGGTPRVDGAHRVSYVLAHGPIPDGHDIDHLCRRPSCVAPSHLEAISHLENVRRGRSSEAQKARHAARTSCREGHALSPENTRVNRQGARLCRICERAYFRRWRAARRSA